MTETPDADLRELAIEALWESGRHGCGADRCSDDLACAACRYDMGADADAVLAVLLEHPDKVRSLLPENGPLLGLATTEELLTEVAVRMEVTQNSLKGRDLGRLCREAIANLDAGVLRYSTARPSDPTGGKS